MEDNKELTVFSIDSLARERIKWRVTGSRWCHLTLDRVRVLFAPMKIYYNVFRRSGGSFNLVSLPIRF